MVREVTTAAGHRTGTDDSSLCLVSEMFMVVISRQSQTVTKLQTYAFTKQGDGHGAVPQSESLHCRDTRGSGPLLQQHKPRAGGPRAQK